MERDGDALVLLLRAAIELGHNNIIILQQEQQIIGRRSERWNVISFET